MTIECLLCEHKLTNDYLMLTMLKLGSWIMTQINLHKHAVNINITVISFN